MWKAHKEMLPINIQKRFEKRENKYNLKGKEIFKKPRFRTKLMERCVSVKGISLWNNLDTEAKESKSNITFKGIIKASLLKKYNEKC